MADLKETLSQVSQQLASIQSTRKSCAKLIETGSIKLVDNGTELREGEEPIGITVSSQEMVQAMLRPVVNQLDAKREQLLNVKEQLLSQLEKGSVEAVSTEAVQPEPDVTEKPKKR